MLALKKVAVTGGVSCGKTTVCALLKESGAFVVSSDEIVHRLLSPQTAIGKQVIHLLGTDIVVGREIDRKKIANLVFSNPEKLHSLETLLHPVVREEIEHLYFSMKDHLDFTLFVAEVPLLYEANMESFFDHVITVIADPSIAQKRFPGEYFAQRMERQALTSKKAAHADFTIVNNSDFDGLKQAVSKITSQLLKEIDSQ